MFYPTRKTSYLLASYWLFFPFIIPYLLYLSLLLLLASSSFSWLFSFVVRSLLLLVRPCFFLLLLIDSLYWFILLFPSSLASFWIILFLLAFSRVLVPLLYSLWLSSYRPVFPGSPCSLLDVIVFCFLLAPLTYSSIFLFNVLAYSHISDFLHVSSRFLLSPFSSLILPRLAFNCLLLLLDVSFCFIWFFLLLLEHSNMSE